MSEPTTSNDERASTGISLMVRLSNGTKFEVSLNDGRKTLNTTTVVSLKEHLSTLTETDNCPVPLQRIIYKGRILDNDRMLSDYNIANNATIFLVKAAGGGATNRPSSSSNPTTAPSSSTAVAPNSSMPNDNVTSSASSNLEPQLPGGNTMPTIPIMFPAVAGAGNTNSNNNNNAFVNMFGNSAGNGMAMPLMPPPDGMDPSALLNNPMVQSILDSNPDFLRNMMRSQLESNPALQQLMDSNPAVRHMLNDPQQFDEMIRMMRNPAAMQQVMRNQDLALSQIENMPGGFAALSNMYETMQRPLEEGFSEARNNGGNTTGHDSTTSSSSAGVNEGAAGAAMPNPWGSSNVRTSMTPRNNLGSSTNNTLSNSTTQPQLDPFALTNFFGGSGGANGTGIPTNNNIASLMSAGAGAASGGVSNNPFGGGGQMPSMDQRQAAMGMLQSNPAMVHMMQQFVRSNPGMFRQMMVQQASGDPTASMMLQNMTDEQFVEYVTQMMNPDTMNQMFQMEQQLRTLGFSGAGSGAAGAAGGQHPTLPFSFAPPPAMVSNNPWANFGSNATTSSTQPSMASSMNNNSLGSLDFSNLFQGIPLASSNVANAGSNSAPFSSPPIISPGERYRVQLRSLYDMGFDDELQNIAALQAVHGNVNRAVDLLLSGTVTATSPTMAPTTTTNSTSSSVEVQATATADELDRGASTATVSNSNNDNNNNNTVAYDDQAQPTQPPKNSDEKKND